MPAQVGLVGGPGGSVTPGGSARRGGGHGGPHLRGSSPGRLPQDDKGTRIAGRRSPGRQSGPRTRRELGWSLSDSECAGGRSTHRRAARHTGVAAAAALDFSVTCTIFQSIWLS